MSNTKMKMIACFSPKGGSGKTTLCTQLATSAKKMGANVCVYDLDPQKSATTYFQHIAEKFRPNTILHDFQNQAPPPETDFIFVDCAPNLDFIPPKQFTIVAPTKGNFLDLHAFRPVLDLEKDGYKVIRVINQYSMVRNDDAKVLQELNPSVVISQNTAISSAMNNFKTIWNSNHSGGKKAKHQFVYLINRILAGSAENLTNTDVMSIGLTGKKENK